MLTTLNPHDRNQPFPDVSMALVDPNGLLAIGGCLSTCRLINAYRHGIFPWYGGDEPILWWSPDPRLVLFPAKLYVSRSLRKSMSNAGFSYSYDLCFEQVVNACAEPRDYTDATWISPEIKQAYCQLFQMGLAHSFEAWLNGKLVGGLYGLSLGGVFFGESMFHRSSNASKAAFAFAIKHLLQWGYRLVDCQVYSSHLASLGAEEIPRTAFIGLLDDYCNLPVSASAWLKERRSV